MQFSRIDTFELVDRISIYTISAVEDSDAQGNEKIVNEENSQAATLIGEGGGVA